MVGGRLRRRAANSEEAFVRGLYEEHGGAVVAYTTKLTGDRAAAEDVLQETLVRAWRRPEALVNGRGSVRAWMLTVAHNLVVDRIRARTARPIEVGGHPAKDPIGPDPADGVVDLLTLMQAMDRLSEEQRIVLTQLYYRGRTVREAAAELDIPSGTVKSRSYHALRALRRTLGGVRPELRAVPA
jgi:RNA polymerase sigma-70 factor, ECF subfamily